MTLLESLLGASFMLFERSSRGPLLISFVKEASNRSLGLLCFGIGKIETLRLGRRVLSFLTPDGSLFRRRSVFGAGRVLPSGYRYA